MRQIKGSTLYYEILSYDKILTDAHKRNRVLFQKLNLPPLSSPGVI